jgi:hypothetical protein
MPDDLARAIADLTDDGLRAVLAALLERVEGLERWTEASRTGSRSAWGDGSIARPLGWPPSATTTSEAGAPAARPEPRTVAPTRRR